MITNFELLDPTSFPFADEVLKWFNDSIYERREPKLESVDLSKVSGTTHPTYADRTWGDIMPVGPLTTYGDGSVYVPGMLNNARTKIKLRQLKDEDGPDYYIGAGRLKPTWTFLRSGEELFIENGHHRTIIGRVFLTVNNLPTIVHNVTVTELVPKSSFIGHS